MSGLRFGIQGSGQHVGRMPDPGRFRAIAQTVEGAGLDSLFAGDHISFHNAILDVVVAVATFAAHTERILVGSAVVLLPLRPAAVVAKEFASLDYVSGGRVVLGVGVGGEGPKDFEAVGVPVSERGARADEAIRAIRALWAGKATFEGRFARFADVHVQPGPARPGGPPIWVAGRAEAPLRRAGRLGDGWFPYMVSPERYAEGLAVVRAAAAAAGRDAAAVEPAALLFARVGPDGARAREEARLHLSSRYGMEFQPHHVERYCVAGTPEECVARIGQYAAAGLRHLVFNPCAEADELLDQVERLATEVVAPARAAHA